MLSLIPTTAIAYQATAGKVADEAVFALAGKIVEACTRWRANDLRENDLLAQYDATLPEMPDALKVRDSDHRLFGPMPLPTFDFANDVGEIIRARECGYIRCMGRSDGPTWEIDANARDRGEELFVAHAAWERTQDNLWKSLGLLNITNEQTTLMARLTSLYTRLASMRAVTIVGIQEKARLCRDTIDDIPCDELIESIVRDLTSLQPDPSDPAIALTRAA